MTLTQTRTPSIEAAIAAHGAWRVLIAAFVALMTRGRRARANPDADELDAYLRRDIGLPPKAAPPDGGRLRRLHSGW